VLEIIDDWNDADSPITLPTDKKALRVFNKIDLSGRKPGINADQHGPFAAISTLTGEGIDAFKKQVLALLGLSNNPSSLFSARRRHVDILINVEKLLVGAHTQFLEAGAGELLAEDLRQAHGKLGEITGRVTSDDLLGEIFSSFCIGK